MKKITLLFMLVAAASFSKAQGLEGIIVEKYYSSDAADSTNAANNSASTILHSGSITYRVFVDMAPGYKFIQMFGNTDALSGNIIHPLVIQTTTDFYNDPNNGQVYPQGNSVTNTKKNTTLIDSWLSVGGVCAGKMGVLKTEDTDGSIGNSNGVLANPLSNGMFGAPINSVNSGAADGMMPGTPLTPNALGITNETDVFDQTPGNTFSVTNGAIAGLGGVAGTTTTNAVLIGQFTTNGVLTFSLNIQISNTVTNVAEVYVPSNAQTSETVFPALSYTSPTTPITNTNVGVGITTNTTESARISIYPNPSKGVFTLSATNVKESAANTYAVYDITGRLVATRNLGKVSGKFSETIDLSDLNSGLYFVNLSLDGVVSTRKLVKE